MFYCQGLVYPRKEMSVQEHTFHVSNERCCKWSFKFKMKTSLSAPPYSSPEYLPISILSVPFFSLPFCHFFLSLPHSFFSSNAGNQISWVWYFSLWFFLSNFLFFPRFLFLIFSFFDIDKLVVGTFLQEVYLGQKHGGNLDPSQWQRKLWN